MVQIELLVVPDCHHEAAAADLITTVVAHTAVQATVTRTVITSQGQARLRGFVGSPDRPAQRLRPVRRPCRAGSDGVPALPTPDGLRGVPTLPDLRQALKREAKTDPS